MKTKNTNKAGKAGKETKKFADGITFVNDSFGIGRVNNYSDEVCFFDLYIKTAIGIACIYGCKVISNDKGSFISYPSTKGSNDKYYNIAYIDISEDMRDAIIDAIESELS